MHAWDRQWFGSVAAIRPYLFQKCLVLLVAVDLLVLMVERGGRYGLDAIPFNVPHFAFLDTFHGLFLPQSVPTATYYVCLAVITSCLAFCLFLGGHRPWLMAIVTVLYTYAWSMSRLDSYLHHYMLSLIMGCMIFFPAVDAFALRDWYTSGAERRSSEAANKSWMMLVAMLLLLAVAYRAALSRNVGLTEMQRWIAMIVSCSILGILILRWQRQQPPGVGPVVSAWAFRLLVFTVGVIYVFTSIAKMDGEWCGGHTLQQIGTTARVLSPIESLSAYLGIPREWFWAGLASFVIPLELLLAGSYLLAVRQDEEGKIWLRRWCGLAWILAIGLHLNNEMMNLIIQWFGYYMLLLATVCLMPARFLCTVGVVFVWPECWLREGFRRCTSDLTNPQAAAMLALTALFAILSLLATGVLAWIAGALIATVILACGFVIVVVAGILAGWERRTLGVSCVVCCASLLMITSVGQSSMTFDYYDLRGKTLQQMGKNAEAIAEMEHAASLSAPSPQAASELHTNLGLSYRRMGDAKAAERNYRAAIALDPRQFLAHYGLANLLMDLKRYPEAESHYRQAILIKSDFSDAYVNLGNLLEFQNRLDEAIQCYEGALAIETDASDVKQLLAAARKRQNEAEP